MEDKITLNVLGCVPITLNMLFELAEDSMNIKSFNILKNLPEEIDQAFVPDASWDIQIYNCYESNYQLNSKGMFAFSVLGVNSKEKVFDLFSQQIKIERKQFVNLIHPTAYVSRSVKLNYGLQVESLSTIAACASVGFGVNIKRNSSIGHHCIIGDYVTINPGVTLSSFVKIGNNTMIGSGSSVKENITIGENTIIGVGSVVVKDIPSNSIAYGNPCVVHKMN